MFYHGIEGLTVVCLYLTYLNPRTESRQGEALDPIFLCITWGRDLRRRKIEFAKNALSAFMQTVPPGIQILQSSQRVTPTHMSSNRGKIDGTARVAVDLKRGRKWSESEDYYFIPGIA